MKYILSIVSILSISTLASAQQLLTLDDAIKTALKANYDILIAQNDADIAQNNHSLGNAGALPQVNLIANDNFNYNSKTVQKLSTGDEIRRSGALSNSLNYGVALNWTLFDGMKMFTTYSKLGEIEEQNMAALKIKVENTVAQVINGYYDIVRQKQTLIALQEALDIMGERLKIAETRQELGSASKLDVLQAKVDLNANRSQMLKQQQMLVDSKVNLNYLMSSPIDGNFEVIDTVAISSIDSYAAIKQQVEQQNSTLAYALRSKNVANLALKEMRSYRLPNIAITGGYLFSQSQNQASIIASSKANGLNAGFTATLPLFNGFNINRNIKNAELQTYSSEQLYNSSKAQLDGATDKAYRGFTNNVAILKMEEDNFLLAKENVDVALLRYKLGSINSLDLKEAQKSYLDAEYRLVSARYDTKVSETNLKKLAGELVK